MAQTPSQESPAQSCSGNSHSCFVSGENCGQNALRLQETGDSEGKSRVREVLGFSLLRHEHACDSSSELQAVFLCVCDKLLPSFKAPVF